MSTPMSAKDHPNNAPGVPMVYPPTFERLQIKYMNPVVKRVARLMPGVAKIRHRGRKSGTTYETVVTPFRKGSVLAITLGHGKTDWVKNVLAAEEADVLFGKRTVHIVNPRIVPAGGDADGLPFMARVQARKMGVLVADIT
jgi:deazaflavin-dependent oxidoreductase (nitroreductase family)